MKNTIKLMKQLGISKENLYRRYRKFKDWRGSWDDPAHLVSLIFNISREDKDTIFFILAGMMNIEEVMEEIEQ